MARAFVALVHEGTQDKLASTYAKIERWKYVTKHDKNVYARMVENCLWGSLMLAIQGLMLDEATIYIDDRKSYDSLILNGCASDKFVLFLKVCGCRAIIDARTCCR